ncbi:neutral zinc metallopeptidase [Nonomuraea wenchangensis]|uniref:Predicted metalloprotease n=1 Tax=Nonomuraea wenchangensis TaxID=568860 RepID=A0A1I0FWE6_9ACTN|nr:neutral zinc metallopeptidase [Nonomuraea wenchangensis]SET62617.1 Predicted metalloprotease [Nonomuraea wenchangensis]
MKRALIILSGIVAVMLPYGTAHAYPIKNNTLTVNAIYSSGALNTTECPEKPIKRRNVKLAEAYVKVVVGCLNTTWAAQFEKSGQAFRRPKLKLVTKPPAKFCALKWDQSEQDAYYCDQTETIFIVLGNDLLDDPSDLYLFNLVSMEYGQHVQTLTDIYSEYEEIDFRNKKELQEQGRRYQLQNNCFGAAFLASVWNSLDRSSADWKLLLSQVKDWTDKDNATRTNIAYWMNQGFSTGDPGACNTWAASVKRVA